MATPGTDDREARRMEPIGKAAFIASVGGTRGYADWTNPDHRFRRLLSEFIGMAGLTFVLSGGAAILVRYGGRALQPWQTVLVLSLVSALWLVVAVYFLGDISAHFNPATTLAFALRRDMGWVMAGVYWIVQFAAAICGSLLARAFFGPAGNLAANGPSPATGRRRDRKVRRPIITLKDGWCGWSATTKRSTPKTRRRPGWPRTRLAVGGTMGWSLLRCIQENAARVRTHVRPSAVRTDHQVARPAAEDGPEAAGCPRSACAACGTVHDRDVNAAGISSPLGRGGEAKACGTGVRPPLTVAAGR